MTIRISSLIVLLTANGELGILGNKVSGMASYLILYLLSIHRFAELERDLELERRKVRELQEASRERDKEYQKLKVDCVCQRFRRFIVDTLTEPA